MAKEASTIHETQVSKPHGNEHAGEHGQANPLHFSLDMFLLFLAVFIIASIILKKYAWRPILDTLDEREKDIREAVENSEKIREEMNKLDVIYKERLDEADRKSQEEIERARQNASELAKGIEQKAHEESRGLIQAAQRDIESAQAHTREILRRESAEIAVGLAGKLIHENLDDEKNRALTDRLINEMNV